MTNENQEQSTETTPEETTPVAAAPEAVAEATTEATSETNSESTDVRDVKPKTPFEHWLKRQFAGHTLRGMLEALRLLESGRTVPFVAFYASDSTGGLKSADLYRLQAASADWKEIARKQQHLLSEIGGQNKLTDDLKLQIERSSDLDRLEDIYVPYKLKRQTLGQQAREAGLGTLADYLWDRAHGHEVAELAGETLADKAAPFAKPETKFADADGVLKGVQDILVERIAEAFELRSLVRSTVLRRAKVRAAKGSKAKPNSKYAKYFEYQEPIGSLKKPSASHRYLAMRKGWMEDELILSFERPDEGALLEKFEQFACPHKEAMGAEILTNAARLALKGSVYTVMENEAHRHLKEEAEQHVVESLGENLRKKVLRPGLGRKAVMGIDPGGANHPCSLALLDSDGKLLLQFAFKLEEATDSNKQEFLQSLENLKIEAIAVAHGPRGKEVRDGFRTILEGAGKQIPIVVVHEHTSSIYSSSPVAKEEFPQLDVSARRAIFVGRYLQDPLGMILKLDPKFLSLGEMQHEVAQGKLRAGLTQAIEASVNFVGVDPNYAPAHVLARVSGLDTELAKAIVADREKNGLFKTREDLKRVPGLEARFESAAGFLRVMDGPERLDQTFVHPRFYGALKGFAAAAGVADPFALSEDQLNAMAEDPTLRDQIGDANLRNIRYELQHPGEDPRGAFQHFEYDPNLKALGDLKKDVPYHGIVTNVTSFGAFVDVGIDQDGLVHLSELTESLAKNPFDSLYPGDEVVVWVTAVNEEKKQISLTMKDPSGRTAGRGAGRGERRPRGERGRRPPRGERGAGAQAQAQAGAEGAPAEGEAQGSGQRRPRRDRRPRNEGGAPNQRPRRILGPEDVNAGPGPSSGPTPVGEGPAPGSHRARGPRDGERGDREGRGGRGERGDRGDRKPREPKKPQRDAKTGAIIKFDDLDGGRGERGGPKLASKAKPHTFNPFANLGALLKDKQGKGSESEGEGN